MLETMDHEITVKWWSRVYQTEGGQLVETPDLKKLYAHLPPDEFYDMPETIRSYIADVQGITEADALVLVGPDKASRGALVGANIEFVLWPGGLR
ncbi:MAG: hypothetical protein ACYS76_04470 [Planctomycetota bacterium]